LEIKDKANFKSVIRQILQSTAGSNFNIKNLGYLPRWVILLLDIAAIAMSCAFTYFVFLWLSLDFFKGENYSLKLLLYFGVNIFFFWWFKTYAGIIRHSSFIDAIKIFFSLAFLTAILVVIDVGSKYVFKHDLYITIALILNPLFSFFLLFSYRVLVKQVFENIVKPIQGGKLVNALIYGADANAISITNALNAEIPSRFKILGFIDKYNLNDTKRILNLPIVSQKKKISVIMRSMGAEALIVADKSLSKEEQMIIVDDCLEYNLKVYTVPLITDWENQQEISKKIKSFQIEDLLDRKPIVLDNKLISNQIKDKTILVTGAAGSIGSEIVRQLLNFEPEKLLIIDQAESPLHDLTLEI